MIRFSHYPALLLVCISLSAAASLHAQEATSIQHAAATEAAPATTTIQPQLPDTAMQAVTDSSALTPAPTAAQPAAGHLNFGQKVLRYFRESNQQRPNKRVDLGVLPGPHFSATTGLGLGILATATYSTDRTDSLLPRSNASVFTDVTTKGFFLVGLMGNHIFPHERYRLDYKVTLSTFSTQFWGVGYENGDNDDNETNYRRNRINALARFMFKIAPNTYFGPFVNYRFMQARNVKPEGEHLWMGQDKTLNATTAGLSFTYDSRDFILNASKGWFVQIDQTFTPRFLGNGDYAFSSTEVALSTYARLWKGAVLAGELHGQFNYGNTPWALLSEVGSNSRMRGYYEGRYRDKNLMEGQLELRQFIKGRSGIVAWVGAAQVFPRFDAINWRQTLPNAGVGYRWEFKKKINVRIDYGFTRNGGGFIFSINEAF